MNSFEGDLKENNRKEWGKKKIRNITKIFLPIFITNKLLLPSIITNKEKSN